MRIQRVRPEEVPEARRGGGRGRTNPAWRALEMFFASGYEAAEIVGLPEGRVQAVYDRLKNAEARQGKVAVRRSGERIFLLRLKGESRDETAACAACGHAEARRESAERVDADVPAGDRDVRALKA